MEFSFLPNSIVNNATDPKDYDSPYSFLAFIQYQNFKTSDVNAQLKEYQSYVNTWASKKNLKKSEEKSLVRDAYINLLREITLNFSTEEEKRFIMNADFNDESDLDIIIPFFIQKLKQISFYYGEKREEVKSSLVKYNLKGSNFGVESIIKKIIYEYVDNNLNTDKQQLSSFYNNFDVSVTELYSETDQFFDNPENTENTYTNKIDPNIFINIKESIIDAISEYPFYLETSSDSILNEFQYDPALTGDELNYLKNRDFINYFQNGEEDLKINLFKSLYPKYIGSDFYYLSTNSQNQSISGILFEANNFDGQYLNKHFPTTIKSQSLNNLYTIYELGGFFVPQNQSILLYSTPKKTYSIDVDNLSPDKVYVFPDPDKVGNTIYTSEQENNIAPITYIIDVEWNRTKISDGFRFNDVLSNNYNQLFYGYQSRQQDVKISTEGIAKVTDNITFWNGDKDQIWKGSFDINKYPIDKDTDDLLLKEGVVVEWYPDEFNNEFSLYKKINTYTKEISSYGLDDGGILLNSNTKFDNREVNNVSLYEKRNINQGKIFIRNNFHNKITNITDSLSTIFIKYPSYVVEEIKDKVLRLFIINNIFVIETENYVISDSYDYDIENNIFKSKNNQPFYNRKEGINKFLDAFINPWYDEKNKKVFLVFLKTIVNSLSASNYRQITPEIYATDISRVNYKKIYPLVDTYTNVYSLSSPYGDVPEINLVEYCGGSFRKNSFLNEYNFTYMAKNLNSIPFIVNEKISYNSEKNTFISESPLLLKPFYYLLDNNFANPRIQYYIRAISNRSGYIGVKDEDSLNVVENIANKTNYAFSSNVDVLQINETGQYVVQFDWESYNDTNIFIGCSAINVKQVQDNILLNFKSNLTYLSSYNENNTIFKFEKDGTEFQVNVLRPTYPYNEVLLFNVTTTDNSTFNGTFCGESIYRKLKIIKEGPGRGEIVTDPPCIKCGDTCEYLYPLNSTVTIIASASPTSVFTGWFGDTSCYAQVNDCSIYLDEDKTILANFEVLPIFNVNVTNNYGAIITFDGKINCSTGTCSNDYYLGTYVTISACPPPPRYKFNRFSGAPCYVGDRVCTFIVYSDIQINSLYSEILYYNLSVSVKSDVFEYPPLLVNTIAGDRELLTNNNELSSLLINPLVQGIVNWEYDGYKTETYGTDTVSLSESTFITLTATPLNNSYIFNRWINGPCNGSNDPVCKLSLNENLDVSAYFKLVTYTVSIVVSGGGVYSMYTVPAGINCDSQIVDPSCEYDFVSGREVTLYVKDLVGSTYVGLYSYDIPSTTSNTTTFKVDKNITLTAVFEPFDYNTLTLFKYGLNRVIIQTDPPSKVSSNLTTTSGADNFAQGTIVNFENQYASNSKILYYDTSVPIVNTYTAGTGINLGASSVDIISNENTNLIFIDDSLIVSNPVLGAPYAQSELTQSASGISITYTDFNVTMNKSVTVSAFMGL